MIDELDRPKIVDENRGADGAGAGPLGTPPKGMHSRTPAPRPAAAALSGRWEDQPMIRPSTHQKVAIDVHRQDWP